MHKFICHTFEVSVHFQTNRWLDWPKTWWVNPFRWVVGGHFLLNSPHFLASPIFSPFPGLWLVKSINGISQAWLTFGHAPLNSNFFCHLIDLVVSMHFAYKPFDGLTSNLVDELIIGLNQTWLTFGPTLLSSCHILTSEWWRSFWISILLFKFTVPNKILKCWDTVAKIAVPLQHPHPPFKCYPS